MMGAAAKRLLCFILLITMLLPFSAVGVHAAQPEEADPDIYDVESLESGLYDWETDAQLANEYEPNVIIIKFKDPSQVPGKEKQLQHEIEKVEKIGFVEALDVYIVRIDELEKNPNAVLNRFKNNKYVEYVEPNYLGTLELAPTDPNYKVYGSVFAKNINAEAGWDVITDSSVKVAVVDSGYSGNSDLPAASGYSILRKNTDLTDKYGHGTQVSGTLGAVGNNGDKNVGVVWNANILPVKITESSSATVANVASAVTWAVDNGARIINLSLGFTSASTTLKNAVDYAYKKGCIIVAATGNNSKSTVSYPAAYSNVLGVGGTANGAARYPASNYGNGLDVLASYSWYSTTISGNNTISSGTSISSPQVAGLAALVWELAPDLSNMQVMDLIRANTNRADGKWDSQTGYGVIDMGKTLTAAQELSGAPAQKDTVPPVIKLKGDAEMELGEGGTYEEPGYTATDDTDGDITSSVTVSGTVATAYAGKYTLTYTVYDKAGNTATAKRIITVTPTSVAPSKEPTITQVGSNPIILHLGGSVYVEQGATAYDEVDGDLSGAVVISGDVDTTKAGTYQVTYSVTNSAGLSANITREVRVLAPTETLTRTPYNFSDQGKKGASFNYSVNAEAAGVVSLAVSGLNKATLHVTVTDSAGNTVLDQDFPGNASQDFSVSEGTCSITATIVKANGNAKFDLSLQMPEVMTAYFADEEVPLAAPPAQAQSPALLVVLIVIIAILAVTVVVLLVMLKKRGTPEKE